MDERERRIAENEIVYRAINEKIEDLSKVFGTRTEPMALVCECGDLACTERIDIEVTAYERVRSDPTYFIVRPGHEIPDVEHVVEQQDSYEVVCKDAPETADLARETNPRSSG
jgi:hypothetical protein